MNIFEHPHYRSYLRAEFTERLNARPKYSLRAFSKKLGIQVSQLSDVLKGTRGISPALAAQVAQKLQLGTKEAEYLVLLVQKDRAKTEIEKESLERRLRELNSNYTVRDLSLEVFRAISDWYHIPIFEMATLKNFKMNSKTIAQRLALSTPQAQEALDRLERLELLCRTPEGNYTRTSPRIHFGSEIPNGALRHYHKQMLQKTIESLETQTPQEKMIGSETISIDLHLLPQAKNLTQKYLQDMVKLFEESQNKTETYHLGVQFFRLTRPLSLQKNKKGDQSQ